MSETLELVIVRHGESTRNHATEIAHQGFTELLERQMAEEQDETFWPLTDLGRQQAQLAGEWLKKEYADGFDHAYVSPYLRARETADQLGLGLDWVPDDRIRERDWGNYLDPEFPPYSVPEYLADLSQCSHLSWKSCYPGAESILDMVPRVISFLQARTSQTGSQRIVIVTHGGTIRAFETVVEHLGQPGMADFPTRLTNCCVVMYRLDHWDWELNRIDGETRNAHPAIPGYPVSEWLPFGRVRNLAS
jgi:broad specificity phosphatase PhoE